MLVKVNRQKGIILLKLFDLSKQTPGLRSCLELYDFATWLSDCQAAVQNFAASSFTERYWDGMSRGRLIEKTL